MGRGISHAYTHLAAVLLTLSLFVQSGLSTDPTSPTSAICGDCCSSGTFCTATTDSATLSQSAGGLPGGYVFPAGSTMTCYLKDRDQAGAVDGGLCIPDSVRNVTAFCSDFTGRAASTVVPTMYQANLQSQDKTCSPCCDGQNVCSSNFKCSKVDGQASGGVCIPNDQPFSSGLCPGKSLIDDVLFCETCNAFTAAAQQLIAPAAEFSTKSEPAPVPSPDLG